MPRQRSPIRTAGCGVISSARRTTRHIADVRPPHNRRHRRLRRDLISTLVGEAVSSIDWPTDWRGVARTFAYGLHDLLMRHPLVLEAHRQASLEAPGADDTAHRVVSAFPWQASRTSRPRTHTARCMISSPDTSQFNWDAALSTAHLPIDARHRCSHFITIPPEGSSSESPSSWTVWRRSRSKEPHHDEQRDHNRNSRRVGASYHILRVRRSDWPPGSRGPRITWQPIRRALTPQRVFDGRHTADSPRSTRLRTHGSVHGQGISFLGRRLRHPGRSPRVGLGHTDGFLRSGGYALAVAAAVPERVSKLVLACA